MPTNPRYCIRLGMIPMRCIRSSRLRIVRSAATHNQYINISSGEFRCYGRGR